jgi:hypothetical protein
MMFKEDTKRGSRGEKRRGEERKEEQEGRRGDATR